MYHIPQSLSHKKENQTDAPFWNLDMPTTPVYSKEDKEQDENLILDLKLLDEVRNKRCTLSRVNKRSLINS